ncbi:MAG: hypothetical protein E6R13_06870 [Spirochaetes bacterium]|nr:MAG: hypothetical protein E6R13_06870 [Spirochaetota bacterium]
MMKFLKTKEFKMILGFIIFIIIILAVLKTCNSPKPLTQKELKLKEYEQKIKLYEDSLLVINKSLQKTQIIKDTVYLKHQDFKQKITKTKDDLSKGKIDTIILVETLEQAFTNCDSLNNVNDTIISIQKSKIEVLDSIINTQEYKESKMKEDISFLNKSLKKQKRVSTGKTIGYTLVGVATGFLIGFGVGYLK